MAKYVFYIYLKNAWINLKSGLFWAYFVLYLGSGMPFI
jgi:hypothetical protein